MNKKQLIIVVLLLLLTSPFAYAEQVQISKEAINHLHDRARQLKDEGRYAEAKVIFKQILAIQPKNPNAHFDLGNVYLCQGKYVEAIDLYEEAIKLGLSDKHTLTYYFNLSMCYIGLGRNKEAIYCLKQCLDINPDYAEAKDLLELVEDEYKRGGRLEIGTED